MSTKKLAVDVDCRIADAEIYSDANHAYCCSLTYTDVSHNSNKFYIMQILHVTTASIVTNSCNYALYTKYGRTGEKGVSNTKWFPDVKQAVKAFTTQYKSKTHNVWGGKFEPKVNCYYDLKVDNYEADDADEPTTASSSTSSIVVNTHNVSDKTASCSDPGGLLNPKVESLIKLISNTNIHLEAIRSFGVNTDKMPLGKINDAVIGEAERILYALSEIIDASADGTWEESREILGLHDNAQADEYLQKLFCSLSNSFWTKIPYASGRNKPPPIISTKEWVGQCADLLDLMKNSKIAGQIVKRSKTTYDIYKDIGVEISVCEDEKEASMIKKFVADTKASSHHYGLQVLEIYRVSKKSKDEFDKFGNTPNHVLLAHGSRMSNFMGILSTGLRVPSNTQVNNGSILGRGIYFADVISKSFNYCNSRDTDDVGFVLLCEVALGDKFDDCDTMVSHNKIQLPIGCTSRRGLGKTTVDLDYYSTSDGYLSDVQVPKGPMKPRSSDELSDFASFLYNEYVIFDARQYRFRYLVKIKSLYK